MICNLDPSSGIFFNPQTTNCLIDAMLLLRLKLLNLKYCHLEKLYNTIWTQVKEQLMIFLTEIEF